MLAVRLGDCDNFQEYASKIHGNMNDYHLCAESDSSTERGGTKPKNELTCYMIKAISKDDDWRVFTELMYDKRDSLANKPEKAIMMMKSHLVWQQQEVNWGSIKLLAPAKTWTQSEMRDSKDTPRFPGSGSWSNGGC